MRLNGVMSKGDTLFWLGVEFARGRVCQGPSLSGAEMSRNHLDMITTYLPLFLLGYYDIRPKLWSRRSG